MTLTNTNGTFLGEIPDPDCSKCPKCGGPADNGNDRCVPPNPYYCTRCMADEDALTLTHPVGAAPEEDEQC